MPAQHQIILLLLVSITICRAFIFQNSQFYDSRVSVACRSSSLKRLQTITQLSKLPITRAQALRTTPNKMSLNLGTLASHLTSSPHALFQTIFIFVSTVAIASKFLDRDQESSSKAAEAGPEVRSLQIRFLTVFWLLRMADWLQGPYFYEVYASKIIGGQAVSMDLVSKLFLVGFGTTGILGPWVGRFIDTYGRRAGTLAFAALYTLGALSVRSASLPILFLGRLANGVGTSLLFSAPESWLVGEHNKNGFDGRWLSQTFSWAYAGDSLVAISAGLLAGSAASARGPAGPFEASVVFLVAGAALAAARWGENRAPTARADKAGPTIGEAAGMVAKDRRILLVGAVQALFEGAMYIFVLQWPPSLIRVAGSSSMVPFGMVFSCFMACCLLGSNIFAALTRRGVPVERTAAGMLVAAAGSMALAAARGTCQPAVVAAFLAFEVCVGVYFPAIGTLRSRYLPDSHRSVLVNLFGIPLNLIVVSVYLSIGKLGVDGALACAAAALACAAAAQAVLAFARLPPPPSPGQ